jgi:putative peptide zinc metalloprotease protein
LGATDHGLGADCDLEGLAGLMAEGFLSSDWYRVAPMAPRLRGQVDIHRQVFRGDIWHVVQDHHSGRYHRITQQGNFILSMMNGRRTVAQLWEAACDRFDDAPPTQSEVIRLLAQLHSADLIATDLPNIEEIGERHARQERQTMLARLRNPLALRMPILDPDDFLNATMWLVRPLFSWTGFIAWVVLALTGFVLMVMQWDALTENFGERVLAAENLLLLFLAYPVLKAAHELGHAYATKVWGGEVHEIGMMLLVFMPVPYVDASASAAFANKWRRAVVGGAGIMVELATATFALIFWIYAEPGLARAFAFNIMMIGGVSTLLFNGNPLLRFDGYYVFSDIIEMPGLGQRANKYIWYLCQRYILRIKDAESPVRARGERKWLFSYSIAAFIYRLFISVAIALFVASKFFVIGVLLAIWALGNTFVKPIWTGLKYLATTPKLQGRRRAVNTAIGLAGSLAVAAILLVPLPYTTTAYGVVWLNESAFLRTQTVGFVTDVPVDHGLVSAGKPVLLLDEPDLNNQAALAQSRLDEARMRLSSVLLVDQVQTNVFRDQIALIQGQLDDVETRKGKLTLRAPHDGTLLVPQVEDLLGIWLMQGDAVGYVLTDEPMRLRVAVGQDRAELVRERTRGVSLKFLSDPGTSVDGRIVAQSPESANTLPSAALSTDGGGTFTLDPARKDEIGTLERIFLFDVAPADNRPVTHVGERALVRFDHGPEPLGFRVWRTVRQLFLAQFNV